MKNIELSVEYNIQEIKNIELKTYDIIENGKILDFCKVILTFEDGKTEIVEVYHDLTKAEERYNFLMDIIFPENKWCNGF